MSDVVHLQHQCVLVFQRQRLILGGVVGIRTADERAVVSCGPAARNLGRLLGNELGHALITGLHNREWNNYNVIRSGRRRHQCPLEGRPACRGGGDEISVLVVDVKVEVVVGRGPRDGHFCAANMRVPVRRVNVYRQREVIADGGRVEAGRRALRRIRDCGGSIKMSLPGNTFCR